MVSISRQRLDELKHNFKGKRIAIVGDMMLDCYYWGDVKRISPEAPVPVIEIENEFFRFGGAANVALNILKLGGVAHPIGVIGYDNNGSVFRSLINENSIEDDGLIIDDSRPTTAKTRVIAQKQHVVRIDKESKDYISESIQQKVLDYIKNNIEHFDGIILQDYNKGVLTPLLITNIIELAQSNKKLITVDPKFSNFFSYQNVTVFKPNRKETEDALSIRIKTKEDISMAGSMLLEKLNAQYIMLTLGEEGIAIFERGKVEERMPTKARKVADVSGAGDTVIATLTMALAAGANILEASYLANFAGGIVCEEVGIVPIEPDKLFEIVNGDLADE
ncbi:MAG: D-glycero-beta-D-manno-heptose-7-phosphate kinase [Ignavibacteriaceae bacterium]|nr:D-glycero-beta-D-manno-heptose-7-phosphate kinase [Ignavibacteriaceae bacterium]